MNSTQIAKLAGVSRSTVSKVLHNYSDIPEETKKRVLKVIQEQGYRPNIMSQALKGITPKIMSVYFFERLRNVSPPESINCHYNMAMLTAISLEAKKLGYTVTYEVIFDSDSEDDIIAAVNEAFASRRICTAVFVGLDDDCNFIDKVAALDRHIILLDKGVDTTSGTRCLFSNDYNSSIRACEHLYSNGFDHIMHISGESYKLSGRERLNGYFSAMQRFKDRYSINCEPHVIPGVFSVEHGYKAGLIFLKDKLYEHYNGITCGCDMIAIGFLKCLHEHSPRLIDELGVIGFDNDKVDLYLTPSVSTMSPNYRNFAHLIFDLEQNYEEFKGGMTLKIDHELIERDSSRPKERRTYHDLRLESR